MPRMKTMVLMIGAALATLGCAAITSENTEVSIQPVSRVRHGSDANALYQTGRYFQGQIRYDRAIAAYKEALAVDAKQADAHNGLGVIYATQGRHELAEQSFKAAIAARPRSAYLHNNLGYHYLQLDRLDEALAAFERARKLDPGNARVAANLAAVRAKLGTTAESEVAATPPVAPPPSRARPVLPQPAPASGYTV